MSAPDPQLDGPGAPCRACNRTGDWHSFLDDCQLARPPFRSTEPEVQTASAWLEANFPEEVGPGTPNARLRLTTSLEAFGREWHRRGYVCGYEQARAVLVSSREKLPTVADAIRLLELARGTGPVTATLSGPRCARCEERPPCDPEGCDGCSHFPTCEGCQAMPVLVEAALTLEDWRTIDRALERYEETQHSSYRGPAWVQLRQGIARLIAAAPPTGTPWTSSPEDRVKVLEQLAEDYPGAQVRAYMGGYSAWLAKPEAEARMRNPGECWGVHVTHSIDETWIGNIDEPAIFDEGTALWLANVANRAHPKFVHEARRLDLCTRCGRFILDGGVVSMAADRESFRHRDGECPSPRAHAETQHEQLDLLALDVEARLGTLLSQRPGALGGRLVGVAHAMLADLHKRVAAVVAGLPRPPALSVSVREAARRAQPLGGADAQGLEGALAQVEREFLEARSKLAEQVSLREERDKAREERKAAQVWREDLEQTRAERAELRDEVLELRASRAAWEGRDAVLKAEVEKAKLLSVTYGKAIAERDALQARLDLALRIYKAGRIQDGRLTMGQWALLGDAVDPVSPSTHNDRSGDGPG